MSKASAIPTLSLSSLSAGKFMFRPAGPRDAARNQRHRDDYYLFGIMLSGEQELSVDFRDITVKEHQAIIVSPGQLHRPLGKVSTEGFGIAFAPEALSESEIALIDEYSLNPDPLTLGTEDFGSVNALYEILLSRGDKDTDVEFSIASAIKGIILQQIGISEKTCPGRYLRLVLDFRKLLKDNISKIKSPSEFASLLNVSGVYLNEAVKAVTGLSVSAYIISYVILCAKRKLAFTDLSAQESAFTPGYDDYSYFSRLFRKQTGISPRTFRQRYLE